MHPLHGYAATDQQRNVLSAIETEGTNLKASKLLGINIRTVERNLARVKALAAKQGYSPEHDMTKTVPEGYHLRGVSTLYGSEGEIKSQWVKSQVNKEEQTAHFLQAMTEAFESYKGQSVVSPLPDAEQHYDTDLITVYPMGDPHIGMYAWAEEAGEDFNCEIAEANLKGAVRNLVARSPSSEVGLILNLGDFFHADNLSNTTARSGNPLDVDSRWSRVLYIGAKTMIECVYAALEKHKKVIVKNIIGNHDDHTSQALSLALSLYFENDRRVLVADDPAKFWYYQFGKVLIGSTHGDTAKPDSLPGIMAADKPMEWGTSLHRYWYTGHIHTLNRKEFHGCVWESFRTLAAKDAWHSAQGYRSGRDMQSIVHHREYGEIERHTLNISMLRAS